LAITKSKQNTKTTKNMESWQLVSLFCAHVCAFEVFLWCAFEVCKTERVREAREVLLAIKK